MLQGELPAFQRATLGWRWALHGMRREHSLASQGCGLRDSHAFWWIVRSYYSPLFLLYRSHLDSILIASIDRGHR